MPRGLILAAALAAPAAVFAAVHPAALSRVEPGLWELRGLPGARMPVRQCVANVAALAQFEHRGRGCSRTIVSDNGSSTVINYDCGAAGFGHSQVDVLTPRSLRISTQGISEQLPFGYTLQAHRIAACENPDSSRH